MFGNLFNKISGKDDLERVAEKDDLPTLIAYLKTRPLIIPRRPKYFLDAATLKQEELLAMMEKETRELNAERFEPWILVIDGKKRLPAFSSQKKMEVFSGKISQEIDKVFALGGAEFLIEEITQHVEVDFVDLNLHNEKSWEIGVGRSKAG